MDIATCLIDGHTYTATEFSRLETGDAIVKGRQLICVECEKQAYFRKPSRNGRGACFFARPHADNCQLAAQDNDVPIPGAGDDEDEIANPGDRIIVDLNFGADAPNLHIDGDPAAPRRPRGGAHIGDGAPGVGRMHRRPSGLLRMLVDAPNFRYSDQAIEIPNQQPMAARDFFVAFEDITPIYEHQFRGYWGQLTDAGESTDGTLWLNSGGRGEMSLRINPSDRATIMARYRLEDLADFTGAYILFLGVLRINSKNGKMVCFIDDLDLMALR